MTDEPDDAPEEADPSRPRGSREPDARRDRSGLVAGEAAAIARFGEGPALFAADVPAPRHPHVGPLLPHRRAALRASDATASTLVRARRDLPARIDDRSAWDRAGSAARRGVAVVVDWTARGVVAAVDVVGAAAQAVVTLLFGPERQVAPPCER
jgi:hypothetical protein